jgi:hypothetical protein
MMNELPEQLSTHGTRLLEFGLRRSGPRLAGTFLCQFVRTE